MAQTNLEIGFMPTNLSISGGVTMHEEFMGMNPSGQLPYNILQDDQELNVNFRFNCSGTLVGSLYGHWHFGVHFKRIGPGTDPPSLWWNGPDGLLTSNVNQTINVPANHFGVVLEEGQNLFEVVTTVVFHEANAPQGLPIAGFQELGLIQKYVD